MATARIFAGNCNLNTTVITKMAPDGNVALEVTSECPHIQKAFENVSSIDPFGELSFKMGDGPVIQSIMRESCPHPSCPVFSGIARAVEVAAGLALPTDIHITFE